MSTPALRTLEYLDLFGRRTILRYAHQAKLNAANPNVSDVSRARFLVLAEVQIRLMLGLRDVAADPYVAAWKELCR